MEGEGPLRITLFFAWEVGRESILTIDKLMRRKRAMVNSCYLCKEAAEWCNHILLWCPVIYSLQTIVYGLLRINWVIAGLVRDEIWVWEGICKKKKIINNIPLTISWVVWKEMNRSVFEEIEWEISKIKDGWFHYFGSLILRHGIYRMEDFGNVVDILTDL